MFISIRDYSYHSGSKDYNIQPQRVLRNRINIWEDSFALIYLKVNYRTECI